MDGEVLLGGRAGGGQAGGSGRRRRRAGGGLLRFAHLLASIACNVCMYVLQVSISETGLSWSVSIVRPVLTSAIR